MIIQAKTINQLYHASDMERFHPESPAQTVQGDDFEIDLSRIIHSGAFRRLQAKTQVIGMYVGDLHRTRLTHSMEVAQIARQIAITLNQTTDHFADDELLDVSLVEAAALAHDLGHPPFGHRGEDALHQCMYEYGGFEANAHSFRLLTQLEGASEEGLNLTRALLLAIMKYPILLGAAINDQQKRHPPKASLFSSERKHFGWALEPFSDPERAYLLAYDEQAGQYRQTKHKTLECSLLEIADDIAYGTHDVEDAINLGFVQLSDLTEIMKPYANIGDPRLAKAFSMLARLHPASEQVKYRLKRVFTLMTAALISAVTIQPSVASFTSPRLKYQAILATNLQQLLAQLHELVAEEVIYSHRVQTVAYRGSYIVKQLFDALMTETSLLPKNDRRRIRQASTTAQQARIVCDYIAGMTDSFAMKIHARLFGPSDRFFDY